MYKMHTGANGTLKKQLNAYLLVEFKPGGKTFGVLVLESKKPHLP